MTQPSLPIRTSGLRVFSASLLSALLIIMPFVQLAAAEKRSEVRSQRSEQTADGRRQDAASNTANAPENTFLNVPVPKPAPEPLVGPVIVATKDDGVLLTNTVNPGDTVTYTVNIQNNGTASPADDATNVQFSDTIDAHTTLVADSTVAAVSDKYNTIGNTQISVPDGSTDLLANDVDPDPPASGTNAGMTVTAYGATTGTEQTSMGSPTATAQGGSVTVNANGSFTYDPPLGFEGTDTFKYRAADIDGFTAITTVTITIAGMIWYVNNNAGACTSSCDGRLSNPFQTLAAFQAVNNGAGSNPAAGDNIFLYESATAYVGPVTLLNNQKFIGQDATASLASITGVTAPSGTDPFPAMNTGGNAVTITSAANAINLGLDNTLRGFTVGATTGTKISGVSFGTLIVGNSASPDVILSGAGQALNLSTGVLSVAGGFVSVATTSSGTQGINFAAISDSDGAGGSSFSFGSTTVSGSTTQGIFIGTTTADLNFGNTSVTGGTDGISLQNNSAGTRTFGTLNIQNNTLIGFVHAVGGGATTVAGATTITNPGTIGISVDASTTLVSFGNANVTQSGGTGVSFTNNANANGDLTFADLDISPDANQAGLVANNNAGTLTSTTGDISTTNAAAVSSTSSVLALALNSVSAANSGGSQTAINLTTSTGTFSSSAGTITGGTNPAVLVNAGSVQVTYGGGITQASNAALLSVSNANTSAINFNGNLNATNGTGLQFDNADGIYNFNSTTTLNGGGVGDTGIDILNGSAGTFSFGGTTIINPTGVALNVSASSGAISISGAISKTSGGRLIDFDNYDTGTATISGTLTCNTSCDGIEVTNNGASSGTVNFSGATKTLNTGADIAVNLDNNDGGTINFTGGGLDIDTTSATGFNAINGGTVTVTGSSNTLSSTTGIALNVVSTNIGLSGLNFVSIAANGSANGIVLNSTGTTAGTHGSLTVAGDGNVAVGGNSSGGTIQNTTSHGISLTTTRAPSFTNINIQSATGSCIDGTGVVNFTLVNSTLNNCGTVAASDSSNVAFNDQSVGTENNLSGVVNISNNVLTNAAFHGVDIYNHAGTISDVDINGNTITSSTSTATSKGSGIRLVAFGSAATVANVTKGDINNNTISNFPSGAGILAFGGNANTSGGAPAGVYGTLNHATDIINITGNTIKGQSAANRMGTNAIQASVAGRGQGNYNISNNGTVANPITNIAGNVISTSSLGVATVSMTIDNNVIVANHATDFGGPFGISTGAGQVTGIGGTASMFVVITDNNVSQTDSSGIRVTAGESTASVHAAIKNNTVAAPIGAGIANGIRIDSGTSTGIDNTVCIEISGNVSAGESGQPGIGLRKQGTVATTNDFGIEGLAPSPATAAQTAAFVAGQNPGSSGGVLIISGDNFVSCATAPVAMNNIPAPQREYVASTINSESKGTDALTTAATTRELSTSTAVSQPSFLTPIATVLATSASEVGLQIAPANAEVRSRQSEVRTHAVESRLESKDVTSDVRTHHAVNSKLETRNSKPDEESGLRAHYAKLSTLATRNAAPTAPLADTVTANIGPLPAGGSVTITFQVTVENPPNLALAQRTPPRVENQGTVSYDFGTPQTPVLTDDPETGTAGDKTVTLIDLYGTTTTVQTSGSPSDEGDPVTFTATVAPNNLPFAPPGGTNPTGTVQFLDGATPITCTGTGESGTSTGETLVGGSATCTTSTLTSAGSPHTINVNYSGDGNFDPSNGNTTQVINACTQNPVVTNTNDSGAGSLRDALATVCSAPNNNVTFNIPDPEPGLSGGIYTITLTTGELVVAKNVNITGPNSGANTFPIVVSGNNASRVFHINLGKTATIRNLTMTKGSAPGATYPDGHGGAILNEGTLNVLNSTISDSSANDGGGGIYNKEPSGSLTVINSTFNGNSTVNVGSVGGGINNNATMTVINSTFSGNSAPGGGGGIFNNIAGATITNCTIVNNTSTGNGSGVRADGSVTLRNTIVANNTAAPDVSGVFDTTNGFNLIEDPGIVVIAANNITGQDPVLGPLANNGGPTMTHALLATSPAIEAGSNANLPADTFDLDGDLNTAEALPVDQRGVGFPRVADSSDPDATQTVDIGAFELHPTIEDITDKTTAEDTAVPQFSFNLGDATGAGSPLITSVLVTNSTNPTLIPVANVVISPGAGDTVRNVNITPAADENGTSTITITVTATNGRTASDDFVVTVTEVNDAPVPTNDVVADIGEDCSSGCTAGKYVIPFATLLGNDTNKGAANESGQTLNITNVSSPTGGTVAINGTDVEFTPTANFFGPAGFTYTVTDNGTTGAPPVADPKSGNATVSFNITAVNDDPTLTTNTGITVNEGSVGNIITSAMLSTSDVDNTPAQLTYTVGTAPVNGTLRKSAGALASGGTFTQADIDGNLITYDHDGSETTTDSFTFTVSDGTASIGPFTFNITITPVNNAPAVTAGGTLNYTENDAATAIDTTITVNDVDSPNLASATAQITGNYVNGEDVLSFTDTATITGVFNAGSGTLTLTGSDTVANYQAALRAVRYHNTSENPSTSARTVSWIVNDGSLPSTAATSTINVTSVNDPPVNTVPGAQGTNLNTPLTFSSVNGNQISVADVDAGTNPIKVTLSVTNGTLTLNNPGGVDFTGTCSGAAGDGTADATMTFCGTLTDVNNSLNGLTYNPTAGFNGGAVLTITSDDQGNTGSGGAQSDTDTVNIQVATNINIQDAQVAEPSSGTTNMVFTVTLSAPAPAGGVSVDFNTVDGTAKDGVGEANQDYTPTNGTVNFAAGQQVQTIHVAVLADGDNSEVDETFTVTLSNASLNATIVDGTATGTITVANPAGTLLISEFRQFGPGPGNDPLDDFVEIYNNTNADITVPAGGYGLFKMGATCTDTPQLIGIIPATTVIPKRGHFLFTGPIVNYSLKDYGGTNAAVNNALLTVDLGANENFGLFATTDVAQISSVNRFDAVGFGANNQNACDLLREGTTLPALAPNAALGQHSFFRKMCEWIQHSGCTVPGIPKDTNDNSVDFWLADTAATVTGRLGAPGPENLTSPIRRDNANNPGSGGIDVFILDGTVGSAAAPNRDRKGGAPEGSFGTMTLRYRVTNNTGGPVTRLRYRIVDISTAIQPAGPTADLRALTSSIESVGSVNDPVTCGGSPTPCTVTVTATTLETPPNQAIGGGYNSTLSSDTVTITPLANGQSILINFKLGVEKTGTFRFYIIIEALP